MPKITNFTIWWNGATLQEKVAHCAQHARRLIKYFDELTKDNDQQHVLERAFEWHLGLHLANRLLKLAETENPDLSELKLIVKILELERKNYGSGWTDLYWQSKSLLDSFAEGNLNENNSEQH